MATITLTDKDGVKFEVEAGSVTKVESLNPLSAMAHRAKSLVTIDHIRKVMVRELDIDIMRDVIMGVMSE